MKTQAAALEHVTTAGPALSEGTRQSTPLILWKAGPTELFPQVRGCSIAMVVPFCKQIQVIVYARGCHGVFTFLQLCSVASLPYFLLLLDLAPPRCPSLTLPAFATSLSPRSAWSQWRGTELGAFTLRSSHKPCDGSIPTFCCVVVVVLFLRKSKLKFREVNYFAQGHTDSKASGWIGLSVSRPVFFP